MVIDEDLSRSLGKELLNLGHEVFDVRDYGFRGKPDEEVLNFTKEQKAALFSADLGFANIVKFPLGSHFGIVILRFPNDMPTKVINTIVLKFMDRISEKDYDGNLVIITPNRVRIRKK